MQNPRRLHRTHRRGFGAALVCSLFVPGSGPAQGYPEARVYRDRAGIPHIESDSEIGLFHAVGYMQAADQMPVIALNALSMTGRLAEVFGPGPRNDASVFPEAFVLNDLIVRLLQVRIDQATFGSAFPPAYRDRMEAFAAGIRKRYQEIKDPTSPEHREWLALAPWIRKTIEGLSAPDLASYSRWSKLVLTFGNAAVDDPHPENVGFIDPGDRLALRRAIAGMTGSLASNGFAWTAPYVSDTDPRRAGPERFLFSGAVAEPHTGPIGPLLTGWYNEWDLPGGGAFMAHLRLSDASDREVWSSFGWSQPGNPYFLVSHNQDVASCGSAGAPNLADCAVLRLRTDASGNAATPYRYYHLWKDGDFDGGQDDSDYETFRRSFVDVPVLEQGNVRTRRFDVFDSDFGIVVNANIFWLHPDFMKLAWRADDAAIARYAQMWQPERGFVSKDKRPGWVPVVTAYRLPARAGHFDRFDTAAFEIMRARGVPDVMAKAAQNLDFAFSVNLACADSAGRLFSCLMGAVPRRYAGFGLPLYSPLSVMQMYRKADRVPLPVLDIADLLWEWNPAGGFLLPVGGAADNRFGLLSYSLFDPIAHTFVPPLRLPVQRPNLPPTYENPGFLTESNDMPWHSWKRMGFARDLTNARLLEMAAADTLYQVWEFFEEPYEKNKVFVKEFEDRLLGTAPLFKVAEVLDTVLGTHVYAYEHYPDPAYNNLPIGPRMIAECADELRGGALNRQVAADLLFFKELWERLANPAPGSLYADPSPLGMTKQPLLLDLTSRERDIAVRAGSATVLRRSDLPLLSFARDSLVLPGGARLDDSRLDPVLQPLFATNEITAITALAAALRGWDGRLGPDSWEHALLKVLFDGIDVAWDCPSSFASAGLAATSSGPVLETAGDPCATASSGTGPAYSGQALPSLSGLHLRKKRLLELTAVFNPALGRDLASLTRRSASVPALVKDPPPLASLLDGAQRPITHPTQAQMLDLLTWLYRFRNDAGQLSTYPFTAAMYQAVLLKRLLDADTRLTTRYGAGYDWGKMARVRVHEPLAVIGAAGHAPRIAYDVAGVPGPGGLAFHAPLPILENGQPISYLVGGGSTKPIITLYAQDPVTRKSTGRRFTWFWNFPGQRVWPWSSHYADHAENFRTRSLREAWLDPALYRDLQFASPEVTNVTQWPLVIR